LGIIQKQAIRGTIYSYLGVLVGFLTTGLLMPRVFTTAENGLLKLLVSYSLLFAQFATLGFNSVTARLFPWFRDPARGHNGYFFIAMMAVLAGTAVSMGLLALLGPWIETHASPGSVLFAHFMHYLYPLLFFSAFFMILDSLHAVLYNAAIGIFSKEFLQRVLILLAILLYYPGGISFPGFVIAYVLALCLPTLHLAISLARQPDFNLRPRRGFVSFSLYKEMSSVAFYGIVSSFSAIVVLQVDSIMIGAMLGLSATGIYAITFYFGTLVRIPSRSVLKIAAPVIADAWKKGDLSTIESIYHKTSLLQLIIGLLVFMGVWVNIDNVFRLLPLEYEPGRYVIFYICLSGLIELATGANATIIGTSKYYKVLTWFMLGLIGLVVGSNYLFIPTMGIRGAALASALSMFVFNFAQYLFILRKWKMQPLRWNHLKVCLVGVALYFAVDAIPYLGSLILDGIIRSVLYAAAYLLVLHWLRLSDDLDAKINETIDWLKRFFTRPN
jgi:O-antigen/teichoic acid export membrane protein